MRRLSFLSGGLRASLGWHPRMLLRCGQGSDRLLALSYRLRQFVVTEWELRVHEVDPVTNELDHFDLEGRRTTRWCRRPDLNECRAQCHRCNHEEHPKSGRTIARVTVTSPSAVDCGRPLVDTLPEDTKVYKRLY